MARAEGSIGSTISVAADQGLKHTAMPAIPLHALKEHRTTSRCHFRRTSIAGSPHGARALEPTLAHLADTSDKLFCVDFFYYDRSRAGLLYGPGCVPQDMQL